MADARSEVLAPRVLILPTIAVAAQNSNAVTGTIAISGGSLVFFDGTNCRTPTLNA